MKKTEKKGKQAAMEAEEQSLLRDRGPLSDSTNLPTTTATRATRQLNRSSIFAKSIPGTNLSANFENSNDFRSPSSASTQSRLVAASSAHGTGGSKLCCSVYSRRKIAKKQKSKEKAVAVPWSCPPAVKTRKIQNNTDKDGEKGQSKACTVPPPKKKQRRADVSFDALLQDVIKQQKEYFAEVDAFELEVEEVDSSEEIE